MIPPFDHNLVIPPHTGNPTQPSDLSPYPANSLEICRRFATSTERIAILQGFFSFRSRLHNLGLHNGIQWLDGSFLEDVETRESRSPRDIDVVTFYWGYNLAFQRNLIRELSEFASFRKAKANFSVDHYPVDASAHPLSTVESTRYWAQLFSHNRNGVWKGMLSLELNTPAQDQEAINFLNLL